MSIVLSLTDCSARAAITTEETMSRFVNFPALYIEAVSHMPLQDLSQLGRPIADTIIIDNSPASYIFHPNNAVPVSSWFNDPHDTELTDLCPFLADLGQVEDVRGVLDGGL